jgi:hypothetical protein
MDTFVKVLAIPKSKKVRIIGLKLVERWAG